MGSDGPRCHGRLGQEGGAGAILPCTALTQAKPLLDEARDYLESPQLLQALRPQRGGDRAKNIAELHLQDTKVWGI